MTEEKKKIEKIEDLEEIGPAIADKLKELGFHTPESLATATVKELLSAGISEKQATKIISKARVSITIEFVRANELMDMKKNVQRLSTGSKTLDELLDSGLETQTITEFYGPYGVDKSILCHQLSVNAQRPIEQRGLNCGVLYIDTEQTFRPEWIIKMANHLGIDPEEATKKILPFLDADALVVSMQNGMCLEILESIIGKARAVACIVSWSSTQLAPASLDITGEGSFIIGRSNGKIDTKIKELKLLLDNVNQLWIPSI